MRQTETGSGDDQLVFLLGWGNRPEHSGVQWLLSRLTEAGYRVTTFELPRTIRSFEEEYLDPVQQFIESLDSCRLLGHSTGGLIARHLETDERLRTRTYLSPWWGLHEEMQGIGLSVVTRLPISTPIISASRDDYREAWGTHVTDDRIADAPAYAAPTFLREATSAQNRMPPFDERGVVFYTPEDQMVDTDTIERQVPEQNRIQYDGGHELFNSRCREAMLDTVLAAIADGIDGATAGTTAATP